MNRTGSSTAAWWPSRASSHGRRNTEAQRQRRLTNRFKAARGMALRATPCAPFPAKALESTRSKGLQNLRFGTLIHSCRFDTQQPALGQNSIGRVGQNSISTNTHGVWQCFLSARMSRSWSMLSKSPLISNSITQS